jgi:hypothetical protein
MIAGVDYVHTLYSRMNNNQTAVLNGQHWRFMSETSEMKTQPRHIFRAGRRATSLTLTCMRGGFLNTMSNAFAVEEATVAGNGELYWNSHDLERERLEERQFHELQIRFACRSVLHLSSGAWPTNLLDDVVLHIFSYLDSLQIMKTRLVNRSFRNIDETQDFAVTMTEMVATTIHSLIPTNLRL